MSVGVHGAHDVDPIPVCSERGCSGDPVWDLPGSCAKMWGAECDRSRQETQDYEECVFLSSQAPDRTQQCYWCNQSVQLAAQPCISRTKLENVRGVDLRRCSLLPLMVDLTEVRPCASSLAWHAPSSLQYTC